MLHELEHPCPPTIIPKSGLNVCFSNRPAGVKRFQTIHGSSVDDADLETEVAQSGAQIILTAYDGVQRPRALNRETELMSAFGTKRTSQLVSQ